MFDSIKKIFNSETDGPSLVYGDKPDISREKSAELFEKAKNYFPGGVNSPVRAFKSVYGTSMLQYQKEKKLLLAMQMVQNTDMQMKNIAFAIGYTNQSKFAANFKKRFDKLPSEVRFL